MAETVPTVCRLCIAHCGVLATVEDDAGRRKVRRLISNTSFQLKGSGWYVTDYARAGGGKEKKGTKDGGGESASSSSSSESSSSKSEGSKSDGGKSGDGAKSESKKSASA